MIITNSIPPKALLPNDFSKSPIKNVTQNNDFSSTVFNTSHSVYNFEVKGHHSYIADGARVHNKSVLSFLKPHEYAGVDWSSLADTSDDGSYDYVEIDRVVNGKPAGTTAYKQEGSGVVRGYTTYTDENGRLVQVQFLRDESGTLQERTIELTGAQFGENVGRIVTPFLTAAILGDDASPFERFASDTIIGTFAQNVFEFSGGYIHDQAISNGEQNDSLDAIAANTFGDFGVELAANAIDGAQNLLTNWVLGEVFESLNADSFEGKLALTLADQGADYIIDLTIHEIATDVLNLDTETIRNLGLSTPDLNNIFAGSNVLGLVFAASIGTLLPDLESTEAQIGSSLITLGLEFFAGVAGIWGAVIGYIGGVVLDFLFGDDPDPQAYRSVYFNDFIGELDVGGIFSDDGGNRALAGNMAKAYVDFINGLIDQAGAKSHNLKHLSQTMNLTFGHLEEGFVNGNGFSYPDAQQAIVARVVETLGALELRDGDAKFSVAIAYMAANSTGLNPQQFLNELSLRTQIAADYQSYLENKELYDELIAADPESAFAAGWATTFALAAQFGYTQDFNVTGDSTHSVHVTSSGNDVVSADAGDDVIRTYAGNDTLQGGDGNDTLYGGSGNDSLSGEEGDDVLYGGGGDNTLKGGWGLDEFIVGQGNNSIFGGQQEDLVTFEYDFIEYSVEDLGDNQVVVTHNQSGAVNQLFDVEFLRFNDTVRTYDPSYDSFVTGTPGDDLLNGTDLRDAINGFAGDDTIYGFDSDDFISGDAGDDQLFGGRGNDWIFGVLGNDLIFSGPGNDVGLGGEHSDYLWGEDGDDSLQGEAGDDVVNGGDGADSLRGGDGDDVLEGSLGDDYLFGDTGDDILHGGDGSDTLDGGNGDDEIFGDASADQVEAGHGDDIVYAGTGNDSISASIGDDSVFAGDGDDEIFGGWGDDIVYGGAGDDKIFALYNASPSNPFVFGGATSLSAKAAHHYGEFGADVAYGGQGNDQIALNSDGAKGFGGEDDDTFHIRGTQNYIDGGDGFDTVRLAFDINPVLHWYESTSGDVAVVISVLRGWTYVQTIAVNVERVYDYLGVQFSKGDTSYPYPSVQFISDQQFSDQFLSKLNDAGYRTIRRQGPDLGNSYSDGTPEQFGDGHDTIVDNATVYRTIGNQVIYLGAGDDYIEAGSGNDSVRGEDGNDVLKGDHGSDTLEGGAGGDELYGGNGSDSILGEVGDDLLDGDAGDDIVYGGRGADQIWGSDGNDTLYGEAEDDRLLGGSGRDLIYGGSGDDTLGGDDAPDTLEGGDGNDSIRGGDGGDSISGGNGDDTLKGELGVDLVRGGSGSDYIVGGDASDELHGDEGDDTLEGGSASDNLFGGSGDDLLFGDAGIDNVSGGAGNDTLVGGADADRLDGGSGVDRASYSNSLLNGVSASLLLGRGTGGEAAGDVFVSIENLEGSGHEDMLTGNALANEIRGLGGNDVLNGEAGDDLLDGGSGDDTIYGGDGNDLIKGVNGNDSLYGGAGRDTLRGWDGDDTLKGEAGEDDLAGANGNDYLYGGEGSDTLDGDAGDDVLEGGSGDDSLIGRDGDDFLYGGSGDDTLLGGNHSDNIIGNSGNDELHGEAGNDILSGDVGDDTLYGGDGDDILIGGDQNDYLYGSSGNDFVLAGSGNDTLNGGDGSDSLDGGSGDDTIIFSSNRQSYTISESEEGFIVTNIASTETDAVSNVEFFEFSDATFNVESLLTILSPPPSADAILIVDGAASETFGNKFNGLSDSDGLVSFAFESISEDLALSLRGYDIDFVDEVEVLLNDSSLGYLAQTANNNYGASQFTIAAADQVSGFNMLEFRQNHNTTYVWGVDQIALSTGADVAPPPLADAMLVLNGAASGTFGNKVNGLTDSDGLLTFAFEEANEDLLLDLHGYDIDFVDEVEVLLNGSSMGFLAQTANNDYGASQFTIAAEDQVSGFNILEFRQTHNNTYVWGIDQVALSTVDDFVF